jgi:cell division protease FtsH
VHKVSVIPRGIGALGYTLQRPAEDRHLVTREELQRKLAVLLAGRAAEKLVFGHLSTGAADDLARASDMAREMVTRFGMEESLGPVAFGRQCSPWLNAQEVRTELDISEATRLRIDEAVQRILVNAFENATHILTRNRPVLERTAQALLEKETLEEADLDHLAADLEPGPGGNGGELQIKVRQVLDEDTGTGTGELIRPVWRTPPVAGSEQAE